MILRFFTMLALIVSLAVPAFAKSATAVGCPSKVTADSCPAPLPAAAPAQSGPERLCPGKALPCAGVTLAARAMRESRLSPQDPQLSPASQVFAPPVRPPRL